MTDGKASSSLNKRNEEIYLERLRKMTGEERMKRAFELCSFVWEMAEASIRNEFPGISDEELKTKLRARMPK